MFAATEVNVAANLEVEEEALLQTESKSDIDLVLFATSFAVSLTSSLNVGNFLIKSSILS